LFSFALDRDVYIQQVSILFRRQCLRDSLDSFESFGPFPSDMHDIPIFSGWSTRTRMSILIAYLESSRKTKSDDYDIIDMQAHSNFCSVYF
jgi:hypothetical protein